MSPFLCLQGELKLTTIQKNVKQSIKDDFSLFCLGIGFDVDYDFLQRIATDNRGMAQRIFGNQETSLQMKVSFCLIASETLFSIAVTPLARSSQNPSFLLESPARYQSYFSLSGPSYCFNNIYNTYFTSLCRINIL